MENSAIITKILNKLESGKSVPLSELTTMLMGVYAKICARQTPAGLLKQYEENCFAKPSHLSPIKLNMQEHALYNMAEEHGISPVLLSPAALLGSCSSVAAVSQNKVLSAIRGTEILADPTNMLALHICNEIKHGRLVSKEPVHLCASSRVVRGQKFGRKDLVQHFSIFGMVSAGRDQGSYGFEAACLVKHIAFYKNFFSANFKAPISLTIRKRKGYSDLDGLVSRMQEKLINDLPGLSVKVDDEPSDNEYYTGLQFTLYAHINEENVTIGDGGFVDWSKKLLGQKKERMLISAIGIDRLCQFR